VQGAHAYDVTFSSFSEIYGYQKLLLNFYQKIAQLRASKT